MKKWNSKRKKMRNDQKRKYINTSRRTNKLFHFTVRKIRIEERKGKERESGKGNRYTKKRHIGRKEYEKGGKGRGRKRDTHTHEKGTIKEKGQATDKSF